MDHITPKILIKLPFMIILMATFLPVSVWAAPSISGVSGSVSNGSSITLLGTDFGASGPNIVIFDDFERGTNGQRIATGAGSATVGSWNSLGENGSQHYTTSVSNSGTKSFQVNVGTTSTSSGYIYARAIFAATKEFFGTWYVYLPSSDPWPGQGSESTQGGPNWKQVWVHSGQKGASCRDSDVVLPTTLSNGSGAICGNCIANYSKYGHNMSKGVWKRSQIYWVGSASGNGTCVSQYLSKNGTNTLTTHVNETNITNMGSDSHNYTMVDMSAYSHVTVGGSSHPTYDDFYFATGPNCRARVELGNRSTYSSCTNLAICTPTSWSNSQIRLTVRSGSFRTGEQAYLFVVKGDGTVISTGYPVTLGGGVSDTQSPAAPAGVSVMVTQ